MNQIENSKYVLNNRKRMYIYTIALAMVIPFILLSDLFEKPIFGISKYVIAVSLICIYSGYYLIRYLLDLNFIHFNIESGKIIFRYYSLRPINRQHRSIEIPITSFGGFRIQKRFFGLKNELILYQKLQGKLAKYPPISITALNKEQTQLLTNTLASLIKE